MACRNTDGCDGVLPLSLKDHDDVYGDDGEDDDDHDDVYNDDETYKVTWGGGDCKLHSRWMSVFERSTAQGYESIQVSVFQ